MLSRAPGPFFVQVDERGVIDFQEVFSPIVKMTTLRILFALIVVQDLELYQIDVKTTFLNGDIDE